ncbi:hypothetical protein L3055_00535 [Corynebacterium sp. MC-02]|uniref:hypothetical protein n=1 Tax=Corynebacterium pseudokroppenstedtii TaxID=2804917 RepID=UPI001F2C968C|nr:hypothetical protein [Corynebacterium pseudokroppenstedtii]MCF8702055.1 hypothetical protein [Corynebacterium pseudokroppenstedtii]
MRTNSGSLLISDGGPVVSWLRDFAGRTFGCVGAGRHSVGRRRGSGASLTECFTAPRNTRRH